MEHIMVLIILFARSSNISLERNPHPNWLYVKVLPIKNVKYLETSRSDKRVMLQTNSKKIT